MRVALIVLSTTVRCAFGHNARADPIIRRDADPDEVAAELQASLDAVCQRTPACHLTEPAPDASPKTVDGTTTTTKKPTVDSAWCEAQWPGAVEGPMRAPAGGDHISTVPTAGVERYDVETGSWTVETVHAAPPQPSEVSELDESALDHISLVSVMPAAAVRPDGKVMVGSYTTDGYATDTYRPGVYFAMSTIVPDQLLGAISDMAAGADGGIVSQRGIAVVVPYRAVEAQLLNVWPFDSIVLGDIDLAAVGATVLYPEGDAPALNPGVNVRLLPYDAKGKRAAVDCLLLREGKAVLQSYEKVGPFRWGAVYGLPDGRRLQLGAGTVNGTRFGEKTARFLAEKYNGTVSFGPEVALVLKNNATEALLPLSILTGSMCSHKKRSWTSWVPGYRYLMDARTLLPLWRGWKAVGDYLLAMIEDRVEGFEYRAHEDQVQNWQTCRDRFSTELEEWDSLELREATSVSRKARGALDQLVQDTWVDKKLATVKAGYGKVHGNVVTALHAQLASVLVPNVVQIIVDPNAFPDLYGFYNQPCADAVRDVLSRMATRNFEVWGGESDVGRPAMRTADYKVEGKCELNVWVDTWRSMLANVFNHYRS